MTNLDVIFCHRKLEFFNVFSIMIVIRVQKNQLPFKRVVVAINIQEWKIVMYYTFTNQKHIQPIKHFQKRCLKNNF